MNAQLVNLLRATPRHRAAVGSVVLLLVLSMPLGGARPTSPAEAQVHPMYQPTVATAASNPAADECGQHADGVVVIQGIFDPPGETLLRLNPVRRYSYRAALSPRQREGRFAVVVTYATGQVTRVPFDALVADDSGKVMHGFFEVVIPVCRTIASISITDANGKKTFARIDGSKILPP